jgi:ribulose-phosphate 3-epimerase
LDPGRYIEETSHIEAILRVIWHIEAPIDHASLIRRVQELKREAGLAISPKTPIDTLAHHAPHVNEILVMGNEPGFSGQELQESAIARAWEIHGRWPEITLGFDIGVNADTIPKLKPAGVTRFCAAGAIFKATDPKEEYTRLQGLLS